MDEYESKCFILTYEASEIPESEWYRDGGEFICRTYFGNEYVRSSSPLSDDQIQNFLILAGNCSGWEEVKQHFKILRYKTVTTLEEEIRLL